MTQRRAVPVAAGVLALLGLVAWLVVRHLTAPLPQRLVDLDVYRQAGRSVLNGRDVYGFLAHAPQRLPFTYPPFAALLAVPLALVPLAVAGAAWTAGEVVCTVVITWLGFAALLPRARRWWPLALGLLTGLMQQMLPLRDEIKFGQVDELLVVLCAVDCLLLARSSGAAGALVGVATAIKLTPGVFVVYLLVTGRRRAAGMSAAVFVAATLLAAAVLPSGSRRFWAHALWHSERLRANDGTANQSLRGMWLRAAGDGHVGLVLWLVTAAIVAVVGFRAAAAAARRGEELSGVAITGLLAVLLSPVAWIHHLCWLPLVLGAVVGAAPSRRRALVATAVWAFYVVKVPWIGSHLVSDTTAGSLPRALARSVQDGFGLAALALVVSAPFWGTPGRTLWGTSSRKTLALRPSARHNQAPPAEAPPTSGSTGRDPNDPAPRAAAGPLGCRAADAARRRPG